MVRGEDGAQIYIISYTTLCTSMIYIHRAHKAASSTYIELCDHVC